MLGKIFKNKLFKNSSIYMLFNVLQALVPFLILPILTRFLSESGMGFYVTYQSVYNLAIPILTQSLDTAVLINYFHISEENFKKYFSTAIFVFPGLILFAFFATLLFSSYISAIIEFDIRVIYITYITVFFCFFNRLALNYFRVLEKPLSFGVHSLSMALLTNGLLVYCVLFDVEISWFEIVASLALGQGLVAIFSIYYLLKLKLIKFVIAKEYVRDLFKIGAPLSLHQIGTWSGNVGSRLVVSAVLGYVAVAHYGVAMTFGAIMTIIQDSFNKAFSPHMYGRLKKLGIIENEKDAISEKRRIVRLTYLYNFSLVVLGVVVSILGYFFIGIIFGEKYRGAHVFIPFAVFGAVFNGMYKMHVVYLFYFKKTLKIAKITILTGILNIAFCYVVLNLFDNAIGAAVSLVITQILAYVLAWYDGQKSIELPWFSFRK
ncbi:lipopolysaccharide biosynthesis protein [Parapedobacter sp. 2B3]|uniref:lipopolysaccharide biosynthesis protein n=1 Tax=Parapedobacter sp. 2B3 TaxID=3342381 RepID=UPI0035B69507